jgi:hypothetical protein
MTSLGLVTLVLLMLTSLAVGGLAVFVVLRWFRGRRVPEQLHTVLVTERIRAVGKLVGLEVSAKEIATVTKGWSWVPPLLLSQARLAMIFHFEKQYSVDLRRITPGDVKDLGNGRFRLTLPPIEGTLRLTDVTPYDIQAGRVLALLDVIQMTAETQKDLMRRAQRQAADLYQVNDARYATEARQSIERHLKALVELFGIQIEFGWADQAAGEAPARRPRRRPRLHTDTEPLAMPA